jgi:serine/threonine protein kinase/Flp pilus assembly protein TadD
LDATVAVAPQATIDPRPQTGPLTPGEPFGSRYHIIRLLGFGGMGAVYQAWDSELGVAVAIKVIRPEATVDPMAAAELERRFKRELVIARQVTHPNVVRIHDLGEIAGIKYITMPYLEGSDLATTLRHAGQLTPARALGIARGIVAGLVAAHKAGVVHRDLKPANIMIEPDGHAVIMDFGIARSTGGPVVSPLDPLTTTLASTMPSGHRPLEKRTVDPSADLTVAGAVVGTIEYMAPEQAQGAIVDQRADIYALGLIVYDMLAGRRRATRDASAIDELHARMEHAPPPVRTIAPDVPEPFARIVARCLEPKPDARYPTSAALHAELDRLDERGHLLPARRSLNLRVVSAGAVAALALISASWWYALRWTSIPEKPHEPLSILIADFQNRTGDPGFDGTLEPALGLSVEGASFITAYSRDQARNAAAQMKAGNRLDDTAALLVSRREGIKVVLAGSVGSSGSGYTIAVRALDTANGKALGSAKASAASKADVLKALAPIAATIRSVLGDTAPESHLVDAETVTASSIDALRAYERAQNLARGGKLEEAVAAYKEAIALDPAMGRAYAGMAVVYYDLKDEARSKAAYAEALKRVDGMTEREKYRTLGTYYLLVAHNYDKAIENYQTLLRRYPADSAGHGNLGMAYMLTGNREGAVAEAREVLKIYPNNQRQRRNLALYLMFSGDFTNAIAEGSRIIADTPGYALGYLPVALSMLASGDEAGAVKTYDRMEASGAAGARLARLGRIDLAMYHGRYTEAARLIGGASEADRANAAEAAQLQVADAQVSLSLGQKARAVEAALKAVAAGTDESVLFPAALVLIDAGQVGEARKIAQTLDGMLQAQTSAYADIINAQIAVHGERYADGIAALRQSIKLHDTWFARLLLGRVYLDTKHVPEAMAEFDLALKRKGEATDAFFSDRPTLRHLPPLYYWLARAQEALGAADARKNYEHYVTLRAGAEPIDPLVTDARARLAKGVR